MEYKEQGLNYYNSQSYNLATIKCSNRNIFVNIDTLKRSEYFRFGLWFELNFEWYLTNCHFKHIVHDLTYSNYLKSFHINARQKFNNHLTFDFTAFPSRTVEILLDALHVHVTSISKRNRNFKTLFELILFLLDDGKLR